MIFFAMDDTGQRPGVIEIPPDSAKEWNEKNYGIFWTWNEFRDNVRRRENLIKINCWMIDIDQGSKTDQLKKIYSGPLLPSLLVETKKGHHLYWFAKDATEENYSAVVEKRLVPFYGADIRAKDVCRILRVPGFYHCKEPNDKFLIKPIEESGTLFSEEEMLMFFRPQKEPPIKSAEMKRVAGNGFWEKVSNIPLVYAFEKLSGHPGVRGERFSLRPNHNRTQQILVNGKSTSSWVDFDGRIGSYDRGGPTICQWLKWYGYDYGKTAEILKEVFANDI